MRGKIMVRRERKYGKERLKRKQTERKGTASKDNKYEGKQRVQEDKKGK